MYSLTVTAVALTGLLANVALADPFVGSGEIHAIQNGQANGCLNNNLEWVSTGCATYTGTALNNPDGEPGFSLKAGNINCNDFNGVLSCTNSGPLSSFYREDDLLSAVAIIPQKGGPTYVDFYAKSGASAQGTTVYTTQVEGTTQTIQLTWVAS